MIRHLLHTLRNYIDAALPNPALNFFFGPTVPNHTHAASTVSMATIPENILVFRTITTLLAHLPRTTPILPLDNLQESEWQDKATRLELKISDAFAQLAVSEHDVVAVSTVRGWSFRLVASTDNGADNGANNQATATETQAESESDSQLGNLVKTLWQFLITRNDRPRDPATSSGGDYPTLITSEKPLDLLEDQTAYQYLQNLEKNWTQPSLPTHLWILTNVLMEGAQRRGEQDFRKELAGHLFRYTAAISCRKLKRRITNQHVSKPYIDALRTVGTMKIPSPPMSQAVQDPENIRNDGLLLKFITAVQAKLDTKTPELLALAKLKPPPFPIYNNTTCTEFHGLLVELLARFEQAIIALCTLSNVRQRPDNYYSQFYNILCDVHLFGYGLLKMARGQACQLHLENIAPLLDSVQQQYNIDPFQSAVPEGSKVELEDEGLDGGLEDAEEELESVLESVLSVDEDKAGTQEALATSYLHWLRLTVAHFDAIEIVMQYVMSDKFTQSSIEVQNLVAPLTSKALYPWQALLKDEQYFPTTDPLNPSSSITNDDILKFLEDFVPKATRAKKLSIAANTASQAWTKRQSQVVGQRMHDIVKLGDEDVKEIATSVLTQLTSWPSKNDDAITKGIVDLHTKLYPLPPGNHFFSSLDNLEFRGALHCEICLASLVDMANKPGTPDSNYANILSDLQLFGRVIGVSKRCCPVCILFLKLLTRGSDTPFIVRGSHSVISACTLPPWTPSHVVDLMVQDFGAMLRRDLVTLMGNMATPRGFARNRSNSTGSETLSVGSYESYDADIHNFEEALQH